MLIVIAAALALVAFVVLFRLLWLSAAPRRSGPEAQSGLSKRSYSLVVTLAAVVLVLGLATLAATGRLSWLAAAGAAAFPFLRRAVGLLRYVPVLGSLWKSLGGARTGTRNGSAGTGQRPAGGAMSRAQAQEILGLGTQPTREEILAAHRRLIQKLHPDRGGSTYLAQQLNEAKARLLDDL
ncbi:MAG: hypothetical protein RIC56_16125 [Pseudomonadales bacterium]